MSRSGDRSPPPRAAGRPEEVRLEEARFPEDAETLRRLLRAYRSALAAEPCFAGFESELAGLPGDYARPRGNAWLVRRGGDGGALGCVALRPLEATGLCEMRRLYVVEAARGRGLGRRLSARAVEWAAAAGYRTLRLDTLQSMAVARGIYARLGFAEVPSYVHDPQAGVVYLELDLAHWRRRQQERP